MKGSVEVLAGGENGLDEDGRQEGFGRGMAASDGRGLRSAAKWAQGGGNVLGSSARLPQPATLAVSSRVAGAAQGEVVREIDDPNTGARWLLMRNDQHPSGPGRLVLAAGGRNRPAISASMAAGQGSEVRVLPVIRTGDRLVVEEHTPVVDAVLDAQALNPAMRGETFNVRLTIGGKVMRAVALGPGRAKFEAQGEVQP